MRRIALIGVIAISTFVSGWSQVYQAYFDASGKTAVFTLKAGEKAGCFVVSTAVVQMVSNKTSSVKVATVSDGILVTLPTVKHGSADVALYDMCGRQIYRQCGVRAPALRLETRTFAMGLYTVTVRLDGKSHTCRFVVCAGRN